MKTSRRPWLCLLALLAFAPIPASSATVARTPVAPCTVADTACSEWVPLKPGARAMIYRTYPLRVRNARITRALIMVHGTLRNADHYFTTATGAAFLAHALRDTIVIAPAIHSADGDCKDQLAPGEVSWACGGNSWRAGGAAVGDPGLTSFDFIDQVLKRLADKSVFPNLKRIVVAGHSAGGQFVSRYEMSSTVGDRLGIPVAYVVANPSSYAWPDATRVLPVDDGAPAAAVIAWKDEQAHSRFSFGSFDAAKVEGYDRWPFGMQGRTGGYAARLSEDQLKKQLVDRATTYLLGQVDTLPLGGFDGSPPAMAQGATRRQRGEAFVSYINGHLGAKARLIIVPECGHNDRCVFTTDSVLPVIFPPPLYSVARR
jgi:pimeloyl-ACP methyl ester carboxylesterase